MIRWLLPLLSFLGAFSALFCVVSSQKSESNFQNTSFPQIPFSSYIAGAGIVEPNTGIILVAPSMAGVIDHVFVQPHQQVKKGTPLFSIDTEETRARYNVAVASLEQARFELKNTHDLWGIVKSLQQGFSVTREEKIRRENACLLAERKIKLQEEELNLVQKQIDLRTVFAPCDGVVLTCDARVGAWVGSNDTPLRFGNLSPLYIRVDVDENECWRIQSQAKGVAFVRGNPVLKSSLKFVRIEPYVRPKVSLTNSSTERVDTRVLQIIYAIEDPSLAVFSGQQMDIYIEDIRETLKNDQSLK